MNDLAQVAIDAARQLGAEYADIRIAEYKRQLLNTEDERVNNITDSENVGFGVRVVAKGAWGFAGSSEINREEIQRITKLAIDIANASATTLRKPVRLTPEPMHQETFTTPYQIDPFSVGIDQKIGLLLEINRSLLKHKGIQKAEALMDLRKVDRFFANTEGSILQSLVFTASAKYQATAVGKGDAKSRTYAPPPRTMGYENIDAGDLLTNTDRVAQQAIEHLQATDCPVGKKDLILDPLNLALTIHESVGHATELDRVLGYEESLAGRSFAVPDLLNQLEYGSPIVNFVADNTLAHGLATHGFDDDGVPGQRWNIVKEGMFVGYGTSREVAGEINLNRSNGTCRASHWSGIPIVRIPNLSLESGKEQISLDQLINDTKDGIYIEGMGSFSIDQMRCNFQFGGDAFWEVKNGQITRMLKNVTYQSMTTEFWNACDAICDQRFWVPNGVLNCGKGDPMQISQMTHGAAPARFRGISVGATQ